MWYDRKDISHEEAEKEYKRTIALEDRDDDELDEARIDDGVKSFEEYCKKNNIKI